MWTDESGIGFWMKYVLGMMEVEWDPDVGKNRIKDWMNKNRWEDIL